MKKQYDILILGATALAAGFAAAHPELETVILEASSSVASEFTNALKTDGTASYEPKTDEAKLLLGEFKDRKAFDENGEWLPAVQPILANSLKNSGADIYYFAILKDVKVNCGGYEITFSAFGIDHSFRVNNIIDTTHNFISHAFFGRTVPEYAEISFNYYTPELEIKKSPCDGDIAKARSEVLNNDGIILREATEISYTPKESFADLGAAVWAASSARSNFLCAFDDGASLAIPNGKPVVSQPKTVYDGAYDVIIVGLGTAGAAAAVTAIEEGLRALVLENLSCGGGAGTLGYVLGYYYGFKGGVYKSIDERAKQLDSHFVLRNVTISADQKITQIDLDTYGKCDVRYNAAFTDVVRDGKKIAGAVWMQDGIRHTAAAKFVIDTTADSAVCVNAGCEMIGGREIDGVMQPYSSMQVRLADGKPRGKYVDNGRMNQYDPDDFGKGITESLSSYLHLLDDYSSHTMLGIAPLIGLREGWKIVGEETVDFKSMIAGRWHKKPVYYGWSNLDNHGKDNALESRIYQDWNTICGMWGWGMNLPIPMGSLIPQGYDGLIAGGRNVSVDHDIAMGLRMKDDASKSGEAAVRLASLAIKNNISAREVDVDELREKLFASECLKPEDEVIRIEKQKCDEVYKFPLWCDDDEKITEGLSSDAPAYYMWSSKTLGKRDLMISLLESDDENTRTNAALTLALLDEKTEKSIEILITAALNRSGYIAKAGRKYIAPRAISAINAIGRVAAKEAVTALYTIIDDESFIEDIPFEPYDFMADRADYYFQYRSHIITSLCDIAKAHPELRMEIKSKLLSYIAGKKLDVTMMGPVIRYDNTEILMKLIESI